MAHEDSFSTPAESAPNLPRDCNALTVGAETNALARVSTSVEAFKPTNRLDNRWDWPSKVLASPMSRSQSDALFETLPKCTISANDQLFKAADSSMLEAADRLVHRLLDPPLDLACEHLALVGLSVCLAELAKVFPSASGLCQSVQPAVDGLKPMNLGAANAEAVASFIRRKKYYFQYLCCLQIGLQADALSQHVQCLNFPLSRTLGAWAIRLALDGWRPGKHAHSRVHSALARPSSRRSRAWTLEQRERAAGDVVYDLRIAVAKNPVAARALGLSCTEPIRDPATDQIAVFNTRFRRRMSDLLEYKTSDSQAGAGGHGTLSPAGLKRAGRELMVAIVAGRREEMHVAIEVLSRLTSEHVQLLPVQLKSEAPPGALAWLDVPSGSYFYTLFKLVDKGARPDVGTEELYELTSQVVQVRLSPPLAQALMQAAARIGGDYSTVSEVLGNVTHGPHHAVAGQGPYRVTASKLQASLPMALLQKGKFRWAVAVATSSPFLVSRGRPAYGVGRQSDIDAVVDDVYAALGWPKCAHDKGDVNLIGSFTTPKMLAVRLALSALAYEADSWTVATGDAADIVSCINAHVAYLSMLLALAYALRNRVIYKLPTHGLRSGVPMKFNDKDVHEFSMPSVPTLALVRHAMRGWETLLRSAVEALSGIGSEDAAALANRLIARLADSESYGWVFSISVAGTLEPAGVHTWRDRLPLKLRLVPNFGRQFWPHQLAGLGVCQLDTDVLLRHQMPVLHPGSSHSCRPEAEIHERLVAAMTEVLERKMNAPVPKALSAPAI